MIKLLRFTKLQFVYLLLLLFVYLFAFPIVATTKWSYLGGENGFRVYKRTVPGSSYLEYMSQGTIKAPILKVMAILSNVDSQCKWMVRCIFARELDRISDTIRVVHYAGDSPWPVRDRDFVVRVEAVIDEDTHWIHLVGKSRLHTSAPVSSKYLRLPDISFTWSFSPTNNGKYTKIHFKSYTNPGGWIPAWLINFFGKSISLKTLSSLESWIINHDADPVFMEKYKQYKDWK